MTGAGREQAAGRPRGIWVPLTSFVGRAEDAAELVRLVDDGRLVTVTGPGGVGKTRLAAEVARRVADRFPDGVWFVQLGAVTDAVQVPAEVTTVLGVQQDPGRPPLETLAEVLAPQRLLIILDNCEHVLPAVAALCGAVLASADDVRILATSREQLGIGGEAGYRLSPLELPGSGELGAVGQSAAAALFVERAAQADPRFVLDAESAPLVARVVARLDGMPLAIELAAARVEALGLAGLADRIDDALRLLAGGDRLAAARQQSLAAVADWSYRLLTEREQQVFRQLAAFPGPFTLEAAEAVAGPDAGPAVLRLVDCSLLLPPQPGGDQRTRYTMLQTLRAYALTRLREADGEQHALAEVAAFAWSVATQAEAGLETRDRELDALRWLDAEDATLTRSLTWALDHDHGTALRLAAALTPWLRLRGRLVEARTRLGLAVAHSSAADESWARAQLWLGYLAAASADVAVAADSYTAAIEAHQNREPSRVLVAALVSGRAITRLNTGDIPGAVQDARRAWTLAHELGDPASELLALTCLSAIDFYAGDAAEALDWTGRAQELLSADVPGYVARWCHYVLALVLTEVGQLDAARRVCAAGLALARQVDDLNDLTSLFLVIADIERLAGNLTDAGAHLGEAIVLASRIGNGQSLANAIEHSGYLCAAAGRWADAVTLWAAVAADWKRRGTSSGPVSRERREEYMQQIRQVLDPGQLREAQERGAGMTVSTAAELAIVVTSSAREKSPQTAPGASLSPRERELVTLVAQGRTNAEIAARLYISVRTVASHLDRIRDKTGYRRRADLTRLAIEESLV
ncbi:MAG TPA: LuxR C-terminal-related transcriptional regulator [Trebonia sp.]|nr:LuxR C-terminal-related transcriptional regulator [Trebonia sp.]